MQGPWRWQRGSQSSGLRAGARRAPPPRRLACESLECRRLLAINHWGADFYVAFPAHAPTAAGDPLELTLTISGPPNTRGTLESFAQQNPVTYEPWRQTFDLGDAESTTISIPASFEANGNGIVQSKGVHVTASDSVTVLAQSRRGNSTDGYLAIPTNALGTNHWVVASGNGNAGGGSQLVVVGTVDGGNVNVLPKADVAGHPAGVWFSEQMFAGESLYLSALRPGDDLTGTTITALSGTVVIVGHSGAQIPAGNGAQGYLVEQLPGQEQLGDEFIVAPLAGRNANDMVRVLATTDGARVRFNGRVVDQLNAGQFLERRITEPTLIDSPDGPLVVAQFSSGVPRGANNLGAPSMTFVPPVNQYADQLQLVVPDDVLQNFVNVALPAAAASTLRVDGAAPTASFTPVRGSDFVTAQLALSPGVHRLTAAAPIGGVQYGFGPQTAYSYPAGFGGGADVSIHGRVFDDANLNGMYDDGERGIGGSLVHLTGVEHVVGGEIYTQTTPDGTFAFADVQPGRHELRHQPNAGYGPGGFTIGGYGGTGEILDTTTRIDLEVGTQQQSAEYRFADWPLSSLSGQRFIDANGDGARQPDEAPLTNGHMELYRRDLDYYPTQYAWPDVQGRFQFNNVAPGVYDLAEIPNPFYLDFDHIPGWIQVGTGGGLVTGINNRGVLQIHVRPGESLTGYDFARVPTATLEGSVGIRASSGFLGIGGVEIELRGQAYGEPVSITTITDGQGHYSFRAAPGVYEVIETQPPDYPDGPEQIGSPGGTVGNDRFSDITLPVGFLAHGYNFYERLRATLQGRVLVDANNNGLVDDADRGVANIGVSLNRLDDDQSWLYETTDDDGRFYFPDVPTGRHLLTSEGSLRFLDRAAFLGSLGGTVRSERDIEISFASGDEGQDYNFLMTGSQVSGAVYHDMNENGQRDSGEPGIGGVEFEIRSFEYSYDPAGPPLMNAVSAADGTFILAGIPQGLYVLKELQPAPYRDGDVSVDPTFGSPESGTTVFVSLDPGRSYEGLLFGETTGSAIQGRVYVDLNRNGQYDDGEPPGTAVFDYFVAGSPVQAYVGSSTGEFQLAGLAPGTNRFSISPGIISYSLAAVTLGSAGGVLVEPGVLEVDLAPLTIATGSEIGLTTELGLVEGTVFLDLNRDSVKNAGELGISQVRVSLYKYEELDSTPGRQATTDAAGRYRFDDVLPGAYYVRVESDDRFQYEPAEAPWHEFFIYVPRNQAVSRDFPATAGELVGTVFVDLNQDGHREEGEPGIAGVTVAIIAQGLAGLEHRVTTTDEDGIYRFQGLAAGTVIVAEANPPVLVDGHDILGDQGGVLLANDVMQFDLTAGASANGYDFGELAGRVRGSVYFDANRNGVRDASELGVYGVAVALTGNGLNGPARWQMATDAGGNFEFGGLTSGEYILTEGAVGGAEDGPETIGSLGGSASAADEIRFTAQSGDDGVGYNFAEFFAAPIIIYAGDTFQPTVNPSGSLAHVQPLPRLYTENRHATLTWGNGQNFLDLQLGETIHVFGRSLQYEIDAADIDTLTLDFPGGNFDGVIVIGSDANETFVFTQGQATISWPGLAVEITGASQVHFIGGGGLDQATLYDSPSNDSLTGTFDSLYWHLPATTALPATVARVENVEVVRVIASQGYDVVDLQGSASPIQFIGRADRSVVSTAAATHTYRGFDDVYVVGSSPNDTATLYDSAGDDSLYLNDDEGTMSVAGATLRFGQIENTRVYFTSGNDWAQLQAGLGYNRLDAAGQVITWSNAGKTTQLRGLRRLDASTYSPDDEAYVRAVDAVLELHGPWRQL